MFFLIRTIGRSTRGQRKPGTPQKPAGPPMTGAAWLLLVVFIIACAGLMELLEKYTGASHGVAFLEAFGVLVVVIAVIAGLFGGGSKGPRIPR